MNQDDSTRLQAALNREAEEKARAVADLERTRKLLRRSLEERARLGRDLHDGAIQSIYTAGMALESTRRLLATDPAQAARDLDRALESLNEVIGELRGYIGELEPASLRTLSLPAALDTLLRRMTASQPVGLVLEIDEEAASEIPPEVASHLLQIVREAASNSLRHARPTRLGIRLGRLGTAIELGIEDDGCGFAPGRERAGNGLANMKSRVGDLGADLRIRSRPGRGTLVIVSIFPRAAP